MENVCAICISRLSAGIATWRQSIVIVVCLMAIIEDQEQHESTKFESNKPYISIG